MEAAHGSTPETCRRHDRAMRDPFGRSIEYLRISVTDKCNLRCVYCMPEEGLPWLPRPRSSRTRRSPRSSAARAAGLRRVRITGGEPSCGPNLAEAGSGMLRAIPDIEDIALSTNAVLLAQMRRSLRAAGVNRVNIRSTRCVRSASPRSRARPGLRSDHGRRLRREDGGLRPIKINVVIMRGRNDDEIEDFARITLERPWHVRFIEVMPVGDKRELTCEHVVPATKCCARVAALGALSRMRPAARQRPARILPVRGARGHGRRHHADEPQLLRALQPHAAHGRWAAAAVPVR